MSTTTHRLTPSRKRAQAWLASLALVAPIHAFGNTDISDVPMSVKNTVAPNIMFTLDDSGSMYWEVLPDFKPQEESFELYYLFPRASNLYSSDSDYQINMLGADPTNRNVRFFRSAAGNPLYYNPAVRYEPWRYADGTLWPNANRASAKMNPALESGPSVNLTSLVEGRADRLLGSDDVWSTVPEEVTFWPATYFVYTGAEPLTRTGASNSQANFRMIEIRDGESYDGTSAYPNRTDCGTSCSYEQELQNFANWFSYHRSRILAARAGIGKAMSQQKPNLRVGFATINSPEAVIDGATSSSVVRGVRPFQGDARTQFFDLLYNRQFGLNTTPLRAAADNVGQYFARSDAGSPWRNTPGGVGSTELSCFKNFHILLTDGYWSEESPARSEIDGANVDNTAGPSHTHADGQRTYTYSPAAPYADAHSGTLADVAMYYWKNDLRTNLENNVPTDARDPAFWQHVATYTIGFGVSGTLTNAQIDSAFTRNPLDFSWPDPFASQSAKLDDLAHAAVNGRGKFFTTSNPARLASELDAMLNAINSALSASAASAVSNPNVTITDNTTYETNYVPGVWTGDLNAFSLDLNTGAPTTSSPWTTSAMTQLDARTSESRKIATYNGSAGIAFRADALLAASQLGLLNTSSTANDAANVLAYLRGDRSGETTLPPTFRPREHLLGAIIHSEPVLVRPPRRNYVDTGYADFRTANESRARMLYVGANDGMMHAFNAQTGAEEWAYVPRQVFPRLKNLAAADFTFQATVDGYLSLGDVNLGNTVGGTGTNWKTLLVGGLGRGGKGYFALDITSAAAADEAAAVSKVLWEFPNASTSTTDVNNLGFAFSRPIIVKHEVVANNGSVSGAGWVVLVSSGYNNGGSGDGQGYLYVLNARTGAVIRAISTGVGTSSSPSGLGQLSAWVDDDNVDNAVKWVYAGDLQGNLWRFDLTASDPNNWTVTQLASLRDSSGAAQPITVAPELARVSAGNRLVNLVAVGTGRYLGDSDVPGTPTATTSATQTQSFYVIADAIPDRNANQFSAITRSELVQRSLTSLSSGRRALTDTTAIDWSRNTTKGWFLDLNLSGERVNTDPAIANTTVAFVTNAPSADPCTPGGSSHLFQLDLVTGSYARGLNTATYVSDYLGRTLASRPVLVKLPSGKVVALVRQSDGTTIAREILTPQTGGASRRLSWRELNYR